MITIMNTSANYLQMFQFPEKFTVFFLQQLPTGTGGVEKLNLVDTQVHNIHEYMQRVGGEKERERETNLTTILSSKQLSNFSALLYSKEPTCWQFLMNSPQSSLLEPTVQRVMGSPTTTNHCFALVTAVLKSCMRVYTYRDRRYRNIMPCT